MYQADTMNSVEGKIITGFVNVCKFSAIKSLKYTQRFTSKYPHGAEPFIIICDITIQ